MPTIKLPTAVGHLAAYRMGEPRPFPEKAVGPFNRVALAAAHVVADPLADIDPWLDVAIDWDRTIAYREHLWDLGLGVAEAMDTAQRGMGLDWTRLARADPPQPRSGSVAPGRRGLLRRRHRSPAAFAKAHHDDVIRAYEEQISAIERLGGRIVLMASRALAACARSPDDYVTVYNRILAQLREPCIIHWLGEMFDPALEGYFGSHDHMAAMDVCVGIITDNVAKVDGIKLSLLDQEKEILLRARLPAGVRMYTGDDFNYAELIAGDGVRHSDALLGIFDPIAPAASAALAALAEEPHRGVPRDPGADRAALPPHLQGADPLLQDRRRVHGVPERPPGPLRHGRRPGERPLARPPRRAVPPCRRRRPAARPRARGRPHAQGHGGARRRGMSLQFVGAGWSIGSCRMAGSCAPVDRKADVLIEPMPRGLVTDDVPRWRSSPGRPVEVARSS